MDENVSQVALVRKEILKLISATLFMYLFSLMGISLVGINFQDWRGGLYIICFSVGFGMLAILVASTMNRVIYYRSVLFVVANLPAIFLLYISAATLASQAMDETPYNLIGINALTMIIGFISQIPNERSNLEIAKKYNIKTGRLNMEMGKWDLSKKLHWNSPDKEEIEVSRAKRLSRLSYLVPGIGFYLSRNLSKNDGLLFMSLLFYFLTFIIAYGSARPFSLILQLSTWEKEIGKKIKFPKP